MSWVQNIQLFVLSGVNEGVNLIKMLSDNGNKLTTDQKSFIIKQSRRIRYEVRNCNRFWQYLYQDRHH